MEQLNTYRVKGKDIGLIFLFKYDLNGNLKLFEVSEGELTTAQMYWLFAPVPNEHGDIILRFPAHEEIMKSVWMKLKAYRDKFEIEVSPADLSFDALWKLYDNKVAKFHAQKAFDKLKEATKIKCFIGVPKYLKYLQSARVTQAHLATYINGQYYDNEYK